MWRREALSGEPEGSKRSRYHISPIVWGWLRVLVVGGIAAYLGSRSYAEPYQDGVERYSQLREHRIQLGPKSNWSEGNIIDFQTKLYHYPDLKTCILRGYVSYYGSSEGGPWAVVVPCPWEVKR